MTIEIIEQEKKNIYIYIYIYIEIRTSDGCVSLFLKQKVYYSRILMKRGEKNGKRMDK